MKIKIEFDLDNDAFQPSYHGEVARILENIAKKISWGRTTEPVVDFNGNRIGRWVIR